LFGGTFAVMNDVHDAGMPPVDPPVIVVS